MGISETTIGRNEEQLTILEEDKKCLLEEKEQLKILKEQNKFLGIFEKEVSRKAQETTNGKGIGAKEVVGSYDKKSR